MCARIGKSLKGDSAPSIGAGGLEDGAELLATARCYRRRKAGARLRAIRNFMAYGVAVRMGAARSEVVEFIRVVRCVRFSF
jgi:hypothetical protein